MKIAIILSAVDKASRVVNTAVSKMQKGLNKFGNYASIGGAAATLFFKKAIDAAEDSQVAHNRLSQVFQSMGQDYETATAQSEAYASALQNQIAVEDEDIMAVQAKIATFEKASNAAARSNDIFNRATKATFDMQAAGFGDAANNAVQLGKALQDPVTGINALRRSGITFTDAEKKKIAALVKTNQLFKAQDIIMKAIEKQVGGVAEKTVTDTDRMIIAWKEVMERIGNGLMPYFTRFANYMLNNVIPAVSNFIDKHPVLIKWLAIGGAALLGFGVIAKASAIALGIFSTVMGTTAVGSLSLFASGISVVGKLLLGSPMLMAIALIATGVYLIIKNWSKIKAFFVRIFRAVGKAISDAWNWIKGIFVGAWNFMVGIWNRIIGFFSGIWNGVKDSAVRLWNGIGDAIIAPIVWIKEKWEALSTWFKNLWEKMKGWAKDAWDWIGDKAKDAWDWIGDKMTVSVSDIANKQMEAYAKAKAMAEMQSNINVNPAANNSPRSGGSISNIFSIPQPAPSPVPIRGGNSTIQLTYSPNVQLTGTASADDVKSMLKDHSMDIRKMVDEANRRKDRTKF